MTYASFLPAGALLTALVTMISLPSMTSSDRKPVIYLKGAGASFPNEVYQAWMTYYTSTRHEHVILHMSYDAVGSGAGKRRIMGVEGPKVDYGGSDSLLDDEIKENYPDMRMFPTMAGAVVIGYNIPELESRLVLSIPVVVGIYNGSILYWDHPDIVDLNPGSALPNVRILVLARADKSGTTSIFTSALCREASWKNAFGIFSQGEDDSKWPNNTITYYAHQNRGMSGLILSFRYSIGYISIADARDSGVSSALLQTDERTIIEANTSTVQVSMEVAAKYLAKSRELTISLAQYSTRESYPIAGLTYMIVYLTSMPDCLVGVELVRYINWFLTSDTAYQICIDNNMTPLSKELAKVVRENIVQKMSCHGENLWEQALAQMEEESKLDNKLLLVSIGLTVCIVLVTSTAIGAYFLAKRIRFLRKLSKREWEVNIEDILFYQAVRTGDDDDEEERFVLWPSLTSLTDVDQVEDGYIILEHILHWPGKWQGITVGLRLLEIKNLRTNSQATQATLLWFKEIQHTNVLKFYGIATLDKNHFMVSDYCSKGSLSQMLKDKKLKLNNDFKFALSLDVASGLAFLHSKNIVHGHLKSTNCLLDMKWTVKISDWEYCRLYREIDRHKCLLLLIHQTAAEIGEDEAAMQEFWTAPEIIKSDFSQQPTYESDVYSLSIVLFEIFARDSPYSEHFGEMPASEILNAIANNNLRPREDEGTPNSVRMIMDMMWSEEPNKRPNIDHIVKLLRGAHNIKKSVVDVMLEVTEEYTKVLHSQVKTVTKRLHQTQQSLRTLIRHNIPNPFIGYVTDRLLSTKSNYSRECLQYVVSKQASVLCVQCTTARVDAKTQWVMFNNLDLILDNLLHAYGGTRVDIALGSFLVVFVDSDPEPLMSGNAVAVQQKTSMKRETSSTAADTVSLSAVSNYSEVFSLSSVFVPSSSKSRTDENPSEQTPTLPHVEAAAEFALQLVRCASEVFITADGGRLTGILTAIHTGEVNMCLLDNTVPRCLYYGQTVDIVRSIVNHSDVDRVLVSDTYKEAVIEEGLTYELQPRVKVNGVLDLSSPNRFVDKHLPLRYDLSRDKPLKSKATDKSNKVNAAKDTSSNI